MVCRKGEKFNGPWGAPAMYALEGGSVGFQIGGEATDLILLVMNDPQSHMLTANDGHAYVVKFANNPQSPRRAGQRVAWLLDRSRARIDDSRTGNSLCAGRARREFTVIGDTGCQFDAEMFTRLAFGSRFISEGQVFDYLPDSALSQVENVRELAGVFAVDKWLCNCDGRQVVFCESQPRPRFRAHFIDFGFCFNAGEWNFPAQSRLSGRVRMGVIRTVVESN
jgi:hypothetical protein